MSITSRVFTELPDPLPAEVVQELHTYEVAWISDAMGANLLDPAIRGVHPSVPKVVGTAATVRIAPGDFLMIPVAMKHSRPGDVLVVDGRGDLSRAVWGEYFSEWARGIGLAGVLIDGACRDASAIEALGYGVFARGTIARGPTMHGPGEVNAPVTCGGVAVFPGDVVVADREGAAVIPRGDLDDLLEAVRATAEGERTHHGMPAGDRAAFDAYFDRAFAPRSADVPRLGRWGA
jgi:regulator of RNase E activity RraA